MFDSFLVLTPLLTLAVLALVRFTGCQVVFPVDEYEDPETTETTETPDAPLAPTDLSVQYGDEK